MEFKDEVIHRFAAAGLILAAMLVILLTGCNQNANPTFGTPDKVWEDNLSRCYMYAFGISCVRKK